METIISILIGAISGFASSYFFWRRQNKLQRPRLRLGFHQSEDDIGQIFLENVGGSFAEKVSCEYGFFHPAGETDRTDNITVDNEIAPKEKAYIPTPTNLSKENSIFTVLYQDVFGNKYEEHWEVNTFEGEILFVERRESY